MSIYTHQFAPYMKKLIDKLTSRNSFNFFFRNKRKTYHLQKLFIIKVRNSKSSFIYIFYKKIYVLLYKSVWKVHFVTYTFIRLIKKNLQLVFSAIWAWYPHIRDKILRNRYRQLYIRLYRYLYHSNVSKRIL